MRLGRAVWVADPAFSRRLGCDPSQCHCLFVESGSGVGGGASRRLLEEEEEEEEEEERRQARVEEEKRRRRRRRRRKRKTGEELGYMRQVFLSASIKTVHFFQEDQPLCLVPHRRYDELVQVSE